MYQMLLTYLMRIVSEQFNNLSAAETSQDFLNKAELVGFKPLHVEKVRKDLASLFCLPTLLTAALIEKKRFNKYSKHFNLK